MAKSPQMVALPDDVHARYKEIAGTGTGSVPLRNLIAAVLREALELDLVKTVSVEARKTGKRKQKVIEGHAGPVVAGENQPPAV